MRLIKLILPILIINFGGCQNTTEVKLLKEIEIPEFTVLKSELLLIPEKGKWYYQNSPFSGYAIQKNRDGRIIEKTGFFHGMREGVYKKWFSNGTLQKEAIYRKNKIEGKTNIWWNNDQLAAEFNFKNGYKHGVQKRWYVNGQLFKLRNLNMGKEEGMQKAWLQNGKIYVNYEAKNGRIFGMNRANLCYKLNKEEVQYAKNN